MTTRRENTGSYVAFLEAAHGHVLLGGVPSTRSSRFSDEADAQAWLEQTVQVNQTASRTLGERWVAWHSAPPEIVRDADGTLRTVEARAARQKK